MSTGISSGFTGYTTQFGYDFDGNLTSIVKSGNTTTFRYDPLGRQVSRTVNGVTTGYGFDGGQLILEEINGSVTGTYTWGTGLIRRNGEFPLTDYRGNVRHMTDGNGTYLATMQADPFGQTVAASGSTGNPYLSNASLGYRSDGDGPTYSAPLQKVGARYYDPQFGVFLTRDTDLSRKPYAYCDGDPVNFNDPSGHEGGPLLNKDQALIVLGIGVTILALLAIPGVIVVGGPVTLAALVIVDISGFVGGVGIGAFAKNVHDDFSGSGNAHDPPDLPKKAGGDGGASVATPETSIPVRMGSDGKWHQTGPPQSGRGDLPVGTPYVPSK
jgi:RHS repeat-associated protein